RWWAETWIPPRTCPGRRIAGVIHTAARRAHKSFLVADQCSVWCICGIDAVLPPRLPEDFITTEKSQMHSSIACGLNICPVLAGPILVMPGRHVNLMISNQGTIPGRIDAGKVGHVVSVCLNPANHWIFSVEYPSRGFQVSCIEWPVVAYLI